MQAKDEAKRKNFLRRPEMTAKELKEAVLNERRAYYRKWRKNNPDKVKRHNENYWRKRALQKAEPQDQQ
jgi:hypothetical protein